MLAQMHEQFHRAHDGSRLLSPSYPSPPSQSNPLSDLLNFPVFLPSHFLPVVFLSQFPSVPYCETKFPGVFFFSPSESQLACLLLGFTGLGRAGPVCPTVPTILYRLKTLLFVPLCLVRDLSFFQPVDKSMTTRNKVSSCQLGLLATQYYRLVARQELHYRN